MDDINKILELSMQTLEEDEQRRRDMEQRRRDMEQAYHDRQKKDQKLADADPAVCLTEDEASQEIKLPCGCVAPDVDTIHRQALEVIEYRRIGCGAVGCVQYITSEQFSQLTGKKYPELDDDSLAVRSMVATGAFGELPPISVIGSFRLGSEGEVAAMCDKVLTIINCAKNCGQMNNGMYTSLGLIDEVNTPIPFALMFDAVEQGLIRGDIVVFHCIEGRSRSMACFVATCMWILKKRPEFKFYLPDDITSVDPTMSSQELYDELLRIVRTYYRRVSGGNPFRGWEEQVVAYFA